MTAAGIPPSWLLSFLLQAEDGIRVVAVTGVQTCALPIWVCSWHQRWSGRRRLRGGRRSRRYICRDRKSVVKGKSVDLGGRRIVQRKQYPLRYPKMSIRVLLYS